MLSGEGTESNPYLITDQESWTAFTEQVREGKSAGKYYKLNNSITTNVMAGTEDHLFSGVFDGSGCTITFNFSSEQGTVSIIIISIARNTVWRST